MDGYMPGAADRCTPNDIGTTRARRTAGRCRPPVNADSADALRMRLNQGLRSVSGDKPCGGGVRLARRAGFIARYRHSRERSGHRKRQLRSAAKAKLVVDMMQMHLHGAFGQMEFAGDFLVAQASRYETGDIAFA